MNTNIKSEVKGQRDLSNFVTNEKHEQFVNEIERLKR